VQRTAKRPSRREKTPDFVEEDLAEAANVLNKFPRGSAALSAKLLLSWTVPSTSHRAQCSIVVLGLLGLVDAVIVPWSQREVAENTLAEHHGGG
jgi:hypothetical protein